MLPLVLYDIPSKIQSVYWSPNTLKPRLALSYKGLPFKTEWVEYPDIAARMKEIRAAPNKRFDGSILYTLPVLSDPNTGAIITDSLQIAEYLEKTYPEKPIFPNQTKALIHVYDAAYFRQIRPSCVFPIMRVKDILNERSVDYFVTTRQKTYNREFSQLSMEGPEREQHWATLEEGYSTIKSWYDKSDGKWLVGDLFSYADIVTGSWLLWMKKVLHRDEWERIASWHDGKLATLLADVERECKLV